MVGREQAVERQQACQQRAEPEDRGSQPRQQRQIGPDRERHQHHDGEEEQHADQRAAADAQRDPDVASNQRGEGGHVAPPIRSSRASIPSGAWVAAMIMPPRARCSRIRPANRSCPAASSAEVGSSSSQTGRRTASSRAIESRRRWPADRYAAGRCAAWSSPTAARLSPVSPAVAAEKIPPERQVFLHAQRRLQRIAMAEIMGLLGQGQFGLAAFQTDRSAGRRQQARDQPQQRGFAGSVRADHRQRLARGGLEIEAGEHLAAAPHTVDVASREPHFALHSPLELMGTASEFVGTALLQHD